MPSRLYLDTAPVIYLIEGVREYASVVESYVATQSLVVSDLTRMECRVKPIRNSQSQLLLDYELFFSEACNEIISLSTEVIDLATEILAKYG